MNNDEPVRSLWDWINRILEGTGRPPVTRRVPGPVAHAAGALLEFGYLALGLDGEPPMTRFVARQLATSHSYDLAPFVEARGGRYREPVSLDAATSLTVAWAASR